VSVHGDFISTKACVVYYLHHPRANLCQHDNNAICIRHPRFVFESERLTIYMKQKCVGQCWVVYNINFLMLSRNSFVTSFYSKNSYGSVLRQSLATKMYSFSNVRGAYKLRFTPDCIVQGLQATDTI